MTRIIFLKNLNRNDVVNDFRVTKRRSRFVCGVLYLLYFSKSKRNKYFFPLVGKCVHADSARICNWEFSKETNGIYRFIRACHYLFILFILHQVLNQR